MECRVYTPTQKSSVFSYGAFFKFNLGNDLLSHNLNTAVSLAMEGLTAGFGMGPGVPPPLWLPRNLLGAVARADVHAHAKHPVRP